MKKFLLSLVAILLVGMGVSAETTVVFDLVGETYGLTRESDNSAPYIDNGTTLTANQGVTVTLNKTDGKNGWRLWGDGLRIYKNSGASMKLDAGSHKITGIAFEMAKANVIEGYSVNGGEEVAVTASNFSVSCNAEVVDLALTVTSNNGAIAKMTVVLDGTPGETPEVEIKEIATLTEFIDEQDLSNYYKITGEVTVTHQGGKYLFITDGTSSLEVYGALPNTYKNGDRLTGIIGKFGYYKNMPQMTPQVESFGAPTAGDPVAPAEVTLDQAGTSQYVILKNVNIVADGTNWNVTDGTTTKQLHNCFNIEGITALDGATIIGVGAVYDEKAQIFPISIEGGTPGEGGDTPDTPDTPEAGDYTIFDISAPGTWTGDANGWTTNVTVNGKAFTITTVKAESTSDLPSPVANTFAWRVYKNSYFTIESKDIDMKTVVITYDDYSNGQYCLEMTLSEGWTGTLSDATYTLTSAGTKTLTCTAVNGQTRIKKVVVSDKEDASIENIEASEDGSVVIYNLRGQRLSAPERGINIINGKKVLVK